MTMRSMLLLFFVAASVILISQAFAHPEDTAYPITELGNCASEQACAEYCSQEVNWQACGDWARAHAEQQGIARPAIEYPIAELGNCASEKECREYCNDPDNIEACIDFAVSKGLMSEEEGERAKRVAGEFQSPEFEGPGGCDGPQACQSYCEEHHDECIDWAVEKGYMTEEDAERAKRFGPGFTGPGGCQGHRECEEYCEENMEECISWAIENGMMTEKEAEAARKFLREGGPGGCRTMKQCKQFCENPDNINTCVDWAASNGFMTREEGERMKRMMLAMQNGPGGCKGFDECEEFCSNPDNMATCINWACDNEFMPEDQCEIAKKYAAGGGFEGPGGCKGAEECEEYCRNNPEDCAEWARQQGTGTVVVGGQIPRACTDRGLSQQECAAFCLQNPTECQTGP